MDVYFDEQIMLKWLEKIEAYFNQIDKKIDALLKQSNENDENKLLDEYDLSKVLRISKKTLERYRRNEWIPCMKVKGKAYYLLPEVRAALKERALLIKKEKEVAKKEKELSKNKKN